MKKLFLILMALFTLPSLWAQAPDGFKYQAVVRDGAGMILADQNVGFEITILQGSPGGTNVYEETHDPTTNAFGLVSLDIGAGTIVSGDFTSIDWSDGPYFMKVAIDETGGTAYSEIGTSELLSVPYAMFAKNVENVDDADADPENEYNNSVALSGTDLEVTDGGGTLSADLSSLVDDADADPTNEYNTAVALTGTDLEVTDGGGTLSTDLSSLIDDADADPANEYNTTVALTGTDLEVTDGGGTLSTDLSSLIDDDDADSTNELITLFEILDDSIKITEQGVVYAISIADLTDGDWIVSGNNIYNPNSDYVGIGTDVPESKLHVEDILDDTDTTGVKIIMTNPSGVENSEALYVESSADAAGSASSIVGISNTTGTVFNISVNGVANGSSNTNRGVQGSTVGTSDANLGLIGFATGTGGPATQANYGSYGSASGSSNINTGAQGFTSGEGTFNIGVRGTANGTGTNNYGVYGFADNGGANSAGFFDGDVTVTGDLFVTGTLSKGGGTFKIDHPLDPANKYLVHSFVESPDMMNIYNGNIVTDAEGYATVTLPDYFESANKEFRYQLTVIGTFAQAIVKEKISGNTFVIQTNEPNVEVSWQVTGIRADEWSEANRVVPEMDKEEPGTYLHPELYNQTDEKSIHHEHLELREENTPLEVNDESDQQ